MIDLKELERRLDEALAKETKDSLNAWLHGQRIYDLKMISWYPCSGGVEVLTSDPQGKYIIEDYADFYSPPIQKRTNKSIKKDSTINVESFFLL